jgi:penicillin-binding protein 2
VGIRQNEKYSSARMAEHLRDHSLYIAFAPLEQPQVALALIVENAGWGSAAAAPIARRVFDYLLLGHYPNEQDLTEVREGRATVPIGLPMPAASAPIPIAAIAANAPSAAGMPGPARPASAVRAVP